MARMKLISSALALMLAGSVGGILAWNLLTGTSRAQGTFGGGGFGEESGEFRPPAEEREPEQVWCEVIFAQLDTADLDEIMAGRDPLITPTGERALLTAKQKAELLRQLRQKPSFEFVGTASIITIGGQQALVQMVEEVRYPTEYELEEPNLVDETALSTTCFGSPGTFETREMGTRFNVTPTVSRDGKVITLVVLPEACRLSGWRNVGGLGEDQPIFLSWNVITTVYLLDGMTCVMTGALTQPFEKSSAMKPGKPLEGMGEKSAVILVSAKIVGAAGSEGREEDER